MRLGGVRAGDDSRGEKAAAPGAGLARLKLEAFAAAPLAPEIYEAVFRPMPGLVEDGQAVFSVRLKLAEVEKNIAALAPGLVVEARAPDAHGAVEGVQQCVGAQFTVIG